MNSYYSYILSALALVAGTQTSGQEAPGQKAIMVNIPAGDTCKQLVLINNQDPARKIIIQLASTNMLPLATFAYLKSHDPNDLLFNILNETRTHLSLNISNASYPKRIILKSCILRLKTAMVEMLNKAHMLGYNAPVHDLCQQITQVNTDSAVSAIESTDSFKYIGFSNKTLWQDIALLYKLVKEYTSLGAFFDLLPVKIALGPVLTHYDYILNLVAPQNQPAEHLSSATDGPSTAPVLDYSSVIVDYMYSRQTLNAYLTTRNYSKNGYREALNTYFTQDQLALLVTIFKLRTPENRLAKTRLMNKNANLINRWDMYFFCAAHLLEFTAQERNQLIAILDLRDDEQFKSELKGLRNQVEKRLQQPPILALPEELRTVAKKRSRVIIDLSQEDESNGTEPIDLDPEPEAAPVLPTNSGHIIDLSLEEDKSQTGSVYVDLEDDVDDDILLLDA